MLRSFFALILLVISFATPLRSGRGQAENITPTSQPVVIRNPLPGQALQGLVTISGDLDVTGFITAELSFTYSGDPRETWFLIAEIDRIPDGEALSEWDTAALTDGDYDLRLLVLTEAGPLEAIVPGLRVRNYSPIETATPAPTASPAPQDTLEPTLTEMPTRTPIPPTPTPLPTNPAQLTTSDIVSSAGRGALFALGLFAFVGIYIAVRNLGRKG